MLLLMGPMGGLGWDNSQTFFRNNWDFFQRNIYKTRPAFITPRSDFGSGKAPWPTFRCGVCLRVLPLDLAHVDHVHPQSLMTFTVVPQNDFFTVEPFDGMAAPRYKVANKGSLNVIIHSGMDQIQYRYYEVEERKVVVGRRALPTSAPAPKPSGPVYGSNLFLYPTAQKAGNPRSVPILDVLQNNLHNLQLLCSYCNVSKGNRDPDAQVTTKKQKTGA